VQYGLLETLLGYKQKAGGYSGVLYKFSSFDRSQKFDSAHNQSAFKAQAGLLIRFLVGVQKNTKIADPAADPWTQTSQFALLRPTGVNACFLILARILERHPDAELDFNAYLKPLRSVNFRRSYVANLGGGWKGFRGLANNMIRKINKTLPKSRRLRLYGQKEKI